MGAGGHEDTHASEADGAPDAGPSELEELRRRAYGPHADIQGDGDAMRRLRALEESARLTAAASSGATVSSPPEPSPLAGQDPPTPDAPAATTPSPDADGSGGVKVASAAVDAPAGAVPPPPETAGPSSARRLALAILVAVALVIVAASAAVWLLQPQPHATLPALDEPADRAPHAEDAGLRDYLGIASDAEATQYEDYEGLSVYSVDGGGGTTCLLIGLDGSGYDFACGRGSIPPTINLLVSDAFQLSDELDLPPWSMLRFVHAGDEVEVWLEEAG